MWDEAWGARARCRSSSPDALFVQGAAQHDAKRVCYGCPVRTECLAEALDGKIEFGVWGGLTERERRILIRRRPNVGSWRALLETARVEHAATADGLSAELAASAS
jgi:WhiB family transcriptional regulator, redox-sensing transcriptional regulator